MRVPLLILASMILAASSTQSRDAALSISRTGAVADWDALVGRYHEEALQGRFDPTAFDAEARPIAQQLHVLVRAGRLDGSEWSSDELFRSRGYYRGPTRACKDLHFAWGLLMEEVLETRLLQYEMVQPPRAEPAKSEPAPQPALIPET